MIFLSHNYKDKDIVGPVAVSLANKYGQGNVFYDSWSIRPGDGIIDEMNNGLERCRYFFFFISQNSLASGMVSLEWQAALHKSVHSDMRFVPIKVDTSNQPAILIYKLYIDMYNECMQHTITRIVDIIDNTNSMPYKATFSNIYCTIEKVSDSDFSVTVKARKFAEPELTVCAIFSNAVEEIEFKLAYNLVSTTGFSRLTDGRFVRFVECHSPSLLPTRALVFNLKSKNGNAIQNLKICKKLMTHILWIYLWSCHETKNNENE